MKLLLTALVFGVWIIFFECLNPLFSMFFSDQSAATFHYSKNVLNLEETSTIEVLVIGDSRSKAAWIPDPQRSWYNVSAGGSTPIDGAKFLNNVLDMGVVPKTVLVSYSAFHLNSIGENYWKRSVNYRTVNFLEHLYLKFLAFQLGDMHFLRQNEFLANYFPGSKAEVFINSMNKVRYHKNKVALEKLKETNGHLYYGRDKGNSEMFNEVYLKEFKPNVTISAVLKNLISRLKSKGVKVAWAYTPINNSSCHKVASEFKRQFTNFVDELNIIVLNQLECMPDREFGDKWHLFSGAPDFTARINEKAKSVNLL